MYLFLSISWLIISVVIVLLILLDRDTSGGESNIFTPSLMYSISSTSKGKRMLLLIISISLIIWATLLYFLCIL